MFIMVIAVSIHNVNILGCAHSHSELEGISCFQSCNGMDPHSFCFSSVRFIMSCKFQSVLHLIPGPQPQATNDIGAHEKVGTLIFILCLKF